MKQFAIIGLGFLARRVLDELLEYDVEILILDKERDIIEQYQDQVSAAYVADAIREETIERIVPPGIDAAIIDMGKRIEASILVTNYLSKRGVQRVIAAAETDQHGEILQLVGATEVIFPNREAAKRLTLPLVSSTLFNYFPIGGNLAIAEIQPPAEIVNKTLVEAELRRKYGLNVIAVRKEGVGEYQFVAPSYRIDQTDVLLTAGREEDLTKLLGSVPQIQREGADVPRLW
ncbi:MAG: potassium channel family protein, partial [bacterium]